MNSRIRTDLALEAASSLPSSSEEEGIKLHSYRRRGIPIQAVEVTNQQGAQSLGKPIGIYLTLQVPPLSDNTQSCDEQTEALAQELLALLPPKGLVLVAGLGNTSITPDALGPKTSEKILATRHFVGEAAQQVGLQNLRPVAALTPGVLGQTGVETAEILAALVREIHPAAVIVVDALAAREFSRLGCTIQLSNSGISPGSGVLNHRKELSSQTLGTQVLSLGIPTVVDAGILARDLLSSSEQPSASLSDSQGASMVVTPKDIDLLVSRGASVLSMAINRALQPDLSAEELSFLIS